MIADWVMEALHQWPAPLFGLQTNTANPHPLRAAPLAYPAPAIAAPAPAIIDSMAKLLAPGVPAYGASPLYGFARKA